MEKDIIKPSEDGKPADLSAQTKAIQNPSKEIMNVKAINYTELIPILIKGMQELNAKNEALQNEVEELKAIIAKGGNATGITPKSAGYIKQNVPNPANNNTVISYYLPETTGKAQINITDMKGSVLKVYNASKGQGQLTIRTGELPAGTYNYSLYVNDQRIDSRQMVIAK